MRRIATGLLALVFMFALFVPVRAEDDSTFSIKLHGAVDTVKFGGEDTFVLDWQFMALKPGLTLYSAQSICIAYDITALQLIRWNAAGTVDGSLWDSTFRNCSGANSTDGVYPYNLRVFAAQSGNTGFLNMSLGDPYEEYGCVQGVFESLMKVRFAFREGKSEDDLNPSSIRLMTIPELQLTRQECAVQLITTEGGGVFYMYRQHWGGVPVGEDKLEPPRLEYPNSSEGVKLKGAIRSYNPNTPITIVLLQGGLEAHRLVIPGSPGTGLDEGEFTFEDVQLGTYDLLITKGGHLDYRITGIAVSDGDIDLTADPTKEYSMITLLAGDVNDDGQISTPDLTILLNSFGGAPTSHPFADINGDGIVSTPDLTILLNNYGKKSEDSTVRY